MTTSTPPQNVKPLPVSGQDVSSTSDTADTGAETVTPTTPADSSMIMTDKRRARLAILNEPTDYSRNQNRLSNVRWPLGTEPYADVHGTDEGDGWVNVKVEQHVADNDPNQRNLLGGGAELRFKCDKCNGPMHIAAEKLITEVIEEAGVKIAPGVDKAKLATEKLIAAVCPNGHIWQLRGDMIERMVKHS